MTQMILLLRGVNVGGNNLLPMKAFKSLLEGLGFDEVQTYIQSGNVVFNDDLVQGNDMAMATISSTISAKIRENYSFDPRILLLTCSEFREAFENNPFHSDEGKQIHFYFLGSAANSPDLIQLNKLKLPSEQFELTEKVFYLYAPDGIGRSKLAAGVEKCLGVQGTGRNLNTVKKILQMASD